MNYIPQFPIQEELSSELSPTTKEKLDQFTKNPVFGAVLKVLADSGLENVGLYGGMAFAIGTDTVGLERFCNHNSLIDPGVLDERLCADADFRASGVLENVDIIVPKLQASLNELSISKGGTIFMVEVRGDAYKRIVVLENGIEVVSVGDLDQLANFIRGVRGALSPVSAGDNVDDWHTFTEASVLKNSKVLLFDSDGIGLIGEDGGGSLTVNPDTIYTSEVYGRLKEGGFDELAQSVLDGIAGSAGRIVSLSSEKMGLVGVFDEQTERFCRDQMNFLAHVRGQGGDRARKYLAERLLRGLASDALSVGRTICLLNVIRPFSATFQDVMDGIGTPENLRRWSNLVAVLNVIDEGKLPLAGKSFMGFVILCSLIAGVENERFSRIAEELDNNWSFRNMAESASWGGVGFVYPHWDCNAATKAYGGILHRVADLISFSDSEREKYIWAGKFVESVNSIMGEL